MTTHMTGTREEWLTARLELLEAEKELTRRSDELARRRQELPWVRIDKEYRFDTDEGSASLADLFRGRSQLLVYHFMFGPDYTAGCPSCSTIADGFNGFVVHLANHDVAFCGGVAGASREAAGVQAADGVDVSLGVLLRQRLQLRLQRPVHRGATARGGHRIQLPARGRRGSCAAARGRSPQIAAMTGTDVATYTRERPGMSAFALEDGVVYHTYSDLCARTGRPLGHVPVARPRTQGAQRDGRLVAPPRRVRQGPSEVVMVAVQPPRDWDLSRPGASERASRQAFLGVFSAAFRCQRGGNDRLVRVHVGDGRDADARRLDDVDGVDADARTDVARRRGVVPRHVGP